MIDIETLARIAGRAANDNMRSVLAGLDACGAEAGLDRPHRLAQYLAQLGHESQGFLYDREVWGPTRAQAGYEGRADLGNTAPGDGSRYRGRTGIQITGRANAKAFRDWCRAAGLNPPDFEASPEKMNTDPWEGLGPIWYWMTRDLNRYADIGDIENVTRVINGGKNGLSDRIDRYARAALVLLGFGPTDVRGFQAAHGGLVVDGDAGPRTRAALHVDLMQIPLPGAADPAPIALVGAASVLSGIADLLADAATADADRLAAIRGLVETYQQGVQ